MKSRATSGSRNDVRLAFRGFDYVIRRDWLERALVRGNQFLLLIIYTPRKPVTYCEPFPQTPHLRHASILWWPACQPAYRRINPVDNLFLNKMLKHDHDVCLLARERNDWCPVNLLRSQLTCKQSRRRARSQRERLRPDTPQQSPFIDKVSSAWKILHSLCNIRWPISLQFFQIIRNHFSTQLFTIVLRFSRALNRAKTILAIYPG